MAIEVYDYRRDIRHILVTPQIRARFLRFEVGSTTRTDERPRGHSHDLGHEVFLVLQGKAEFTIKGETAVLQAGEACIALADEVHTVRNVGDEPVIMYLSVTPHVQPTHTMWTDDGVKAPARFNPAGTYEAPRQEAASTEELVGRHREAVERLSCVVASATDAQRRELATLTEALRDGDKLTAMQARDAMWDELYPLFRQVYELADAWNALTYRTAEANF